MVDGWITIGTQLSTDKFDRQVVELEKKISKEENKKITIGAQLTSQEKDLAKAKQRVDELADAYERMRSAQQAIEKRTATPSQFADFFGMKDTYGSVEQLTNSLDKASDRQTVLENKVEKTKIQYSEISQKVEDYRQKIQSINIQKQAKDVENLKSGFNDVGSSVQTAMRKVSKLALGIFGIRSAFLFLRRASSDLANYDEQYAANLEYIKYALTQAIAPILRYVVNLAAKLLAYINAILQAWFGINLFSNASAESFNKMKSSAGGISSAVKEIKKQLTGFDEINMLTDQSDTGTSSGLGGVGIGPEFDLAQNIEIPEWLKWLIRNKDVILTLITAMAGWKVGSSILEFLSRIGIVKDLGGSLKILAGLTLMITGVTISYGSVKNMLEGDLSAENLLKGIGGARSSWHRSRIIIWRTSRMDSSNSISISCIYNLGI